MPKNRRKKNTGYRPDLIFDRIKEELPNLEAGSDEADQINKHFENTVTHLKIKKEAGDGGDGPSFASLNL